MLIACVTYNSMYYQLINFLHILYMQCPDVEILDAHKQLRDGEIKDAAVIYKRETSRPLSNYHKKMNEAAQELCIQNPGLITKRKQLIEAARSKVIEDGFQFVKGKSRSKKGVDTTSIAEPKPRQKTSQELRERRLKEIEEDLKDLADCIRFKENRISAHESAKEYKKCDDILEEVSVLKQKCRELNAEHKRIDKSNSQSKWYYKRINL